MKADRIQTLHTLAACLRGELPSGIDWHSTIALANESMTVTNLALKILSRDPSSDIPDDVKVFLSDMLARNGHRNERLMEQLEETVLALNQVGITPMLLKGAAILADKNPSESGGRMVSDIDLLVKHEELGGTLTCLEKIGYRIFEWSGIADAPVTLARESDVGMVDVHTSPRGPKLLAASQELYRTCQTVKFAAAKALVPAPTFQILHFILHDQFHSRDYWKGNIDLRHLIDLARIMNRHDINWIFLLSIFANRSSARSFACQMFQVHKLLGAPIPSHFSNSLAARLNYWRILTQLRFPSVRVPFVCLTILTGPNYRNRDAVEHHVDLHWRLRGKLRGIRKLFRSGSIGKI